MLNLRYNLFFFFSICTHPQTGNLCTRSCLRPERINTDYLLLLARHIYPQLKTPSSFESVAGRRFMQSRCTEETRPTKDTLLRLPTSRRNIKGEIKCIYASFQQTFLYARLNGGKDRRRRTESTFGRLDTSHLWVRGDASRPLSVLKRLFARRGKGN